MTRKIPPQALPGPAPEEYDRDWMNSLLRALDQRDRMSSVPGDMYGTTLTITNAETTYVGSRIGTVWVDSNGYLRLTMAAPPSQVGAHTAALAPITVGGTAGSITWDAYGRVTSYVDPT